MDTQSAGELPTAPAPATFQITTWPSMTKSWSGEEKGTTLGALATRLRTYGAMVKPKLPAIGFLTVSAEPALDCEKRGEAEGRGRHRCDRCTTSVSMLWLDHDGPGDGIPAGVDCGVEFLTAHGLAGAAYETRSSTPAAPRWRLGIVLASPWTDVSRWSDVYDEFRKVVSAEMGLPFDSTCRNVSRFYFPGCRQTDDEDPRRVEQVDGLALDLDAWAAAHVATREERTPQPQRTPPPLGDDVGTPYGRQTLERLEAELASTVHPGRHTKAFHVLCRGYELELGGELRAGETDLAVRRALVADGFFDDRGEVQAERELEALQRDAAARATPETAPDRPSTRQRDPGPGDEDVDDCDDARSEPPPSPPPTSILHRLRPTLDALRALDDEIDVEDLYPILQNALPHLAGLSRLDRGLAREALIKAIGKRVSGPAKLVDSMLGEASAEAMATGQGRTMEFSSPEPWPEPVDGAALLAELVAVFEHHLVLPAGAAVALALWVLHTFSYQEAAEVAVRVALTSPERRCGKTSVLTLLDALVCRPLSTASVSASVLFRVVELAHPTLLIDEADATFANGNEDLRGLLNAGFNRGGTVLRCVGDEHEPRAFDVFAPVAIAAIGTLPDTILDRAVKLRMERKLPSQRVARFRRAERITTSYLQRMCARWVADHVEDLRDAHVEAYAGANDREADVWEPLQVIASVAGADWPARCAASFKSITGALAEEPQRLQELVLRDLQEAFGSRSRMSVTDIVDALNAMDESPWRTCRKGSKPLDANKLARLLRPFGLISNRKQEAGVETKGFDRTQLAPVWERYLTRDSRVGGSQPCDPATGKQKQEDRPKNNPATGGNGRRVENKDKSTNSNESRRVAGSEGGDHATEGMSQAREEVW